MGETITPGEGTNLTDLDAEIVLDGTEDTDTLKVKLQEERNARIEERKLIEKETEARRQLTARAHRAEEEAKAAKAAKSPDSTQNLNTNAVSAEDVDIKILQSQGTDEASLELLKKLAKVNNTSVLAAQTDPLYVLHKAQEEAKDKSEKAGLGGSRGSGAARKLKSTTTPNLSDADHRELWRKQNGG